VSWETEIQEYWSEQTSERASDVWLKCEAVAVAVAVVVVDADQEPEIVISMNADDRMVQVACIRCAATKLWARTRTDAT
jgi:hypothetical protein